MDLRQLDSEAMRSLRESTVELHAGQGAGQGDVPGHVDEEDYTVRGMCQRCICSVTSCAYLQYGLDVLESDVSQGMTRAVHCSDPRRGESNGQRKCARACTGGETRLFTCPSTFRWLLLTTGRAYSFQSLQSPGGQVWNNQALC